MVEQAIIDKWVKVRALELGGSDGERDNARRIRERLEREHPGLAAAGAAAERQAAAPPPPQAAPPPGPPPPGPPWGAGWPPGGAGWPPGGWAHRERPAPGATGATGRPGKAPRGAGAAPQPGQPTGQPTGAGHAPTQGPAQGAPLRDFFTRAAGVVSDTLRDLGAGLTLGELAGEAAIDVDENTRSVSVRIRIPQTTIDAARNLTGGSDRELVQLVMMAVQRELLDFLDDDGDNGERR